MLEKIYERNPDNGNYIIEISLENYADIFNDWDHAPFRRRDIDPGLLSFLEDSIDDIPMKNNVDIDFYLSDQLRDGEKEQQIQAWFRMFYRFNIELEKKKIRTIVKKSILCLLASIAFLITSYFGKIAAGESLPVYVVSEILVVGGWVFLWEAISLMTFERAGVRRQIKDDRRFAEADIRFRYKSR